jgi:hypothetical protein
MSMIALVAAIVLIAVLVIVAVTQSNKNRRD